MKEPKNYHGFAFTNPLDTYNKKYLNTKEGKKEVKEQLKRNKKNQKFLKKHGWDKTECWNLDNTITQFILPRLQYFSDNLMGFPYDLSEKKWKKTIKKMLRSFKLLSEDISGETDTEKLKKRNKKIDKGLKLFAKYYSNLWS